MNFFFLKSFLIIFFFITSLAIGLFSLPHTLIALSAQFDRNLRAGDNGEDVKNLQVLLNSDSRTIVSQIGIGSKGQESSYFGQKTKMAVMKFQTLYLPEILGVGTDSIAPTGYVGALTRRKLNELAFPSMNLQSQSQTINSQIPSNISIPPLTEPLPILSGVQKTSEQLSAISFFNSSLYKVSPKLYNLSRYQAKQGMEITIQGSGFVTQENIVHVGQKYQVAGKSNKEGTILTFTVPRDMPNGTYNLYVTNLNGSTYNMSFGDYFTVTDNPLEIPIITQITPSTIDSQTQDKTIVIQGKNFSSTKNSVYSNLGIIENINSFDGSTITISLSQFSSFKSIKPVPGASFILPVYIYVKTDAGISAFPTQIALNF